MSNEILIISGIGIIQSILFSLLLVQKKQKQFSDWLLLLWFIIFAIHLLLIVLIQNNPSQIVIVLAKTFGLLHGPFLLLYCQTVFNETLSVKSLWHLFPFALLTISAFFVNTSNMNSWEILLLILKTISLVSYPIFVSLWLKKKLDLIKLSRADNFIVDSYWLKNLVIVLLIYASIGILHVLLNVVFNIQFSILLDIIFFVVMITIIGFYGLKFKIVYNSDVLIANESITPQYKHSPLKKVETSILKKQIDDFFSETEDYLDPNFSLTQLSNKLSIPKHHLSEIINLEMGTTFYDIVNAKRIQYAMRRINIKSDSNITLEALGYESGYNSKSSFFHHFKKYSGKTPRQYKLEIGSN